MAEVVNTSKFYKFIKSLEKFLKEVRSELKKVIWPTPKQLMINSIAVFSMCVLVGAFIWMVDAILAPLLKLVIGQ